jgi:hypothetical protein
MDYDRLASDLDALNTIKKIVPRVKKTVELGNSPQKSKIIKLVSVQQSSPKQSPMCDEWDTSSLNRIVSEETRFSPRDKEVFDVSNSSSPIRSRSADVKRSLRGEDEMNSESKPTYLKKIISNVKQHSNTRRSPIDDYLYFKIEKDSLVWGRLNSLILRKFNVHRSAHLDDLLTLLKRSHDMISNKKVKRIPRPPRREKRMYKEMSYRIDEYIFKYLIIRGIQNSKPLAVTSPQLKENEDWVPCNYLKSELLIMDLIIHLFQIQDEPFNQHIEVLNANAKRLKEELKGNNVGSDKLKLYAEIIPVLIFNNNAYEAQYLIMEAKIQFPKEIQYWNLWQAFMVIEACLNENKKFEDCESLLNDNSRLNEILKQVQKIVMVYNTYLKLIWRKSSRAAKFAKSSNLGEWENLIVADLYLREGGSLSDAQAIKLLLLCMESKPNIRFLSFVRLANYYRSKAIVTKPSLILNANFK